MSYYVQMKYTTNHEQWELDTIVIDLNGTLSVKGKIPYGVWWRIRRLRRMGFEILLLTGNQRHNAAFIAHHLGMTFVEAHNAKEKGKAMRHLPSKNIVAIGNARIDIETFKNAKISIATLQDEGIHPEILKYVDILVPSINAALDVLIDPDTFAATMKK